MIKKLNVQDEHLQANIKSKILFEAFLKSLQKTFDSGK